MNIVNFFVRHQNEILQATVQHIWLVGVAMLLAVLVGVPLGITVTRHPWLSKPILGGANIAETIPSLALWVSFAPAVVGGACGPAGDCGADVICIAANHSQYVYWHRRH